MKNLIFFSAVSVSCFSFLSAYCVSKDTLQILNVPEVNVYQSRGAFFREDKNVVRFDSLILAHSQSLSLGELFQNYSPTISHIYGGTGAISTISVRGTGADHTQVNWNGFPLNSITTGEMDLSLIGVDMADQIYLVNGASGSLYGNGTFGGALEINNVPDWDNKVNMKIGSEIGSFDKSSQGFLNPGPLDSKRVSAKIKTGNQHYQYQVNFFTQNALNQYPVFDAVFNKDDLIRHNGYNGTGILQTLNLRLKNNNFLDAGFWWQHKDKQFPALQQQNDSSAKAFAKWTKIFNKSSIVVKSAWFYDYLHYFNEFRFPGKDSVLNSRIETQRFLNDVDFRHYFGDILTLDAGAAFYNLQANTNNYNHHILEDWFMLYSAIKCKTGKNIINVSARKDFSGGVNIPFQFSLGLAHNFTLFDIKWNIANRFREPTFNEKYWQPGGNPQLHPEFGWGSDLGGDLHWLGGKLGVTGYTAVINDWIQWIPVGGMISSPRNNTRVWVRGLESSFEHRVALSLVQLSLQVMYNYTLATSRDKSVNKSDTYNKQIRNVPKHGGSVNFTALFFKRFDFSISNTYHSSYFLTDDETGIPVQPVNLTNLGLGYWINFKQIRWRIDFKIQNLFDVNYRLVESYPMPGRAFYVSFNFYFNK